ncbi:hypothetical protein [Parabacteroides sp. FAFU027]|uniref:hypothetical protein n=1 Tax=Parabacteroides sp. FAFU027 TaxID=2922715 RepID=UPI001FAF7CF1|nr:hypothetical protein [Parabacteroides sp. FAFU027]
MRILKEKKIYIHPQIEEVCLDNEITLIMQSNNDADTPPDDPTGYASDYFNNDPYKNNLG